MKYSRDLIEKSYDLAKQRFAAFGVDTDKAIKRFGEIAISLQCWQGDDVRGFEVHEDGLASQNTVTGNYPGAARNATELRGDIEKVLSLSPCCHKVNVHSVYAEPVGKKDRDEYTSEDFANWISWAKEKGVGLDFNPTVFDHPMMVDGMSLSSRRRDVRDFWVRVVKNSREIAETMGRETGKRCYNNIWIPDGMKDIPANRMIYRENLKESLDRIFEDKHDSTLECDCLEGKLFAVGLETFTVGSHEFYLSYAAKNGVGICLDTGHYHPTETITDKLSSVILQVPDVLLHVSRGVRWDSDHVVIQSDDLTALMNEIKRAELFSKVAIGLDFFDASINRVAAWTIGLRAAGKGLLTSLLEPSHLIEKAEADGDFTSRLALLEEIKNLPVNAVWDKLCIDRGVPVSDEWLDEVKKYESDVLSARK